MPTPACTAAHRLRRPTLGAALALSVLAHALAAAGWHHIAHRPSTRPASVAQRHGGMMVLLAPTARQPKAGQTPPRPGAQAHAAEHAQLEPKRPNAAFAPQSGTHGQALSARPAPLSANAGPEAPAPQSEPSRPPPPTPAQHAMADAPVAQPDTPVTPTPAPTADAPVTTSRPSQDGPPTAQPTPPAERPGARFASLFAPIMSQPLGRGHWGGSRPRAATVAVEADAAMRREQAIAGLRLAVQTRMDRLHAELRERPLAARCDLRLSLERQAVDIRCADEADTARLASALQGALNPAASLPPQATDTCWQFDEGVSQWPPCPASPALPTSPASPK